MALLHLGGLRAVETQWAISVVKEYFKLMEAKMEEVERTKMIELEASFSRDTREEYDEYLMTKEQHEDLFEQGLVPAFRYSFVVLLHMLVETQMRAFCLQMQKEREKEKQVKLPTITISDFRGSPIEQSKLYLTKVVGISLGENPRWESLMMLQKVRDCIVHANGDVSRSRDQESLKKLAQQGRYIDIDDGKLIIRKDFCEEQIRNFSDFFKELCTKVGWKVY